MKISYELPFAAKDQDTMTAIYNERGTEVKIPLHNGVYVLDEDQRGERERWNKLLTANGFICLGEIAEDPKEPEPGKFDEPLRFRHPDSTDDSPINAEVEYKYNRKIYPVKIENGIVLTEDLILAKVLKKNGYELMNPHVLERAEG